MIAGPSSGSLEPRSAEAGSSQIRKRKRVLKKKVSKKMLPQVDGPNDSSGMITTNSGGRVAFVTYQIKSNQRIGSISFFLNKIIKNHP